MNHKSLNQLLCAATVNSRFRETLLTDPAKAIAAGYFDQTFSLTPEEQNLVTGIRAQQLEDFAAQIYHWISIKANGNGRNGNGNGNSYKANGNGRNGHQKALDPLDLGEAFEDLYCAPALARA